MSEQFHEEEPVGPNDRGEFERYEDCHDAMCRPEGGRSQPLLTTLAYACAVDGIIREYQFMKLLLRAEAMTELGKTGEN